MDKITKILYGVEQCFLDPCSEEYEEQCSNCPYFDPELTVKECKKDLLDDTLPLLRKQKPKGIISTSEPSWKGKCPSCESLIYRFTNGYEVHYCACCGQAVKWND